MNDFITQAQEAARQWGELNTAFFQQQAQLFQAPWSSRAVLIPDASAVMAGFVKALASADDFMVKAVRLLDVQCAQLLAGYLCSPGQENSSASPWTPCLLAMPLNRAKPRVRDVYVVVAVAFITGGSAPHGPGLVVALQAGGVAVVVLLLSGNECLLLPV
jgi:hypothetical protein